MKTCLTSYTSCHTELINGISEAPLLLQWLSLSLVRPRPATIPSVTPSRIPAPSCVYLSISSPRFFFFNLKKKKLCQNQLFASQVKKKSSGSLAEGFDLTTERAPQIFCYQYSEVLRFAVTFGIHKGFSWDFYSGHQIKKRKLTGRSDTVLENNLWPPVNWRERGAGVAESAPP